MEYSTSLILVYGLSKPRLILKIPTLKKSLYYYSALHESRKSDWLHKLYNILVYHGGVVNRQHHSEYAGHI